MRTLRFYLTAFAALAVFAGSSQAGNIVVNGGFETGDFTDWTLGGNTDFVLTTEDPSYVHSGLWAAALGEDYSDGTLSQELSTTAGSSYVLSFWLSGDGMTPGSFNEFAASVGGFTLYDQTNLDLSSYVELTYTYTATSSMTLLTFTSRNDLDSFFLDVISVNASSVPEPTSLHLFALGAGVSVLARQRQRVASIVRGFIPIHVT
jgi:hypothetical protein